MLLDVECKGLWLPAHTYTKNSKILREIVNLSAGIKIFVKQVIYV